MRAGLGQGAPVAARWWLAGGISPAGCVAAYQPKGAANYAASLVNLNSPGTNDATPLSGAPAFDAALGWVGKTGCTGMQVTGYLTSGGVYSAGVRCAGATAGIGIYDGSLSGSLWRLAVAQAWAGGPVRHYIGGVSSPNITRSTDGINFTTTQDGTNEEAGYWNGAPEASNWGAWLVPDGTRLQCGPYGSGAMSIAAVCWYRVRLTPAQVAALSSAMLDL